VSDCRNDCRNPVAFPRPVRNRPSLDRIVYRIGTYADIRAALLHWRDSDPALAGWTHSESDDPGVALLEGAAIIGDILTFYQDTYANEKFLRTATWRDSVADIVRLVGYRLAAGVGGRGAFAFQVRGDRPVAVPKGFRLSAEVAGRDGQSDFETVAPLSAIPALSRFRLYRPATFPGIAAGTSRFSADTAALEAAGVTVAPGDRLMLVAATGLHRQIATVESVRRQFERTEIAIRGSWEGAAVAGASAYKIVRSFRYFGHNAPNKLTTIDSSGRASQSDVDFTQQVGSAFLVVEVVFVGPPPPPPPHQPLPYLRSIPLDQVVDDLSPGTVMLATLPLGSVSSGTGAPGGDYFFERRVVSTHAETLTRGAMTGAATVVDLDADIALGAGIFILGSAGPLIYTDIRAVELHEVQGGGFAVTAARAPAATTDRSRLYVFGDAATYAQLDGRRIQLARGNVVEEIFATTDPAAAATGSALRPLLLSPQLSAFTLADFPLDAPASLDDPAAVVAWGNVVDATQGRSEREAVLGNGDAREAFQTFKLPKAPLTYHVRAGSTPPETPELEIRVGGRRWSQVASFHGHGGTEEIYVVREDGNGDSWVQFGDGDSGARLPSGLGNVVARYRTGYGAHGPLREDTSVQAGGRLDRLDKIRLLGLATGGDEPEGADNARAAAPGKTQSLGRMVSIADYQAETLAIQGVWRVGARWGLSGNVPAIVLTVLMKTGRDAELAAVRDVLTENNRCRGPQRFPIVVVAGRLEYLYLGASVAIDPSFPEATVLARVREALGVSGAEAEGIDGSRGLLATARRRFGEREYATRLAGTIQNVPGVLWAKVDGVGTLGPAADPATLALPPAPWPVADVVACADDRILCLDRRHVDLKTVAAPAKTCA
jgi:hypothetical protein